jgi:hypothetical protein
MTSPSPTPRERDASLTARPIFESDEVDLRQLARAVWRYRAVVLALGLLGGLAGLAVSYFSTQFVSSGLFLAPDLTLAAYKRYEVALDNEAHLEDFLRLSGVQGTEAARSLRQLVRRPGAMADAVQPAFSLTGREARSYDITVADEAGGQLVGMRLTMRREQKQGPPPVLTLAEYVRSTAILVDLRETMIEQCLMLQRRDQELRNEQLEGQFELSQLEAKADNLRQMVDRTPGAAAIENRQVVSLENGAERFLSPTAQLVAAQVGISDLRLADIRRARERTAALLKKDFHCRARTVLRQPITGQALIEKLETLHHDVFLEQDATQEIVEKTANELDIQRQVWNDFYLQRMRFVASPEGAESRLRQPSLRVGGLIGGVLGGLVGLLCTLLLAWWHDNRDQVLARDLR